MRNSRKEAMKAKCKDCCGNYKDGRYDCCVVACPLYEWMPYRTHEPDRSWVMEKREPTQARVEAGRRLAILGREKRSKAQKTETE